MKFSVSLICGLLSLCHSHLNGAEKQPNILWIVGENLKLDLGCYGAPNVRTPNLDGLAADGVRFTRVFSTSPVCAPSRSAFMVGMYQTTTDMHHMRSHRDDDYRLPPGVRPLTHRLKDAGYTTANVVKIGANRSTAVASPPTIRQNPRSRPKTPPLVPTST